MIKKNHFIRSTVLIVSFMFGVLLCLTITVDAQTPTSGSIRRNATIMTEPGAEVWVNGVNFGNADEKGLLEIKYISPKPPLIVVSADGFSRVNRQLTSYLGEIRIPLKKTNDEAELAFQEAQRLAMLDRDKSAAAYEHTLSLRPKYPEAAVAYARLLLDARRYTEAEKAVNSARKIVPNSAELTVIHARILKDSGDEEGAVEKFKEALKQSGGFQPEANTGLGLFYMERAELGEDGLEASEADYELASKYLRTAVDQLYGSADAPIIHQRLGLVYEKQRRFKQAIAVYEEFLQLYPDSIEATAVKSFIVQLKKELEDQ